MLKLSYLLSELDETGVVETPNREDLERIKKVLVLEGKDLSDLFYEYDPKYGIYKIEYFKSI